MLGSFVGSNSQGYAEPVEYVSTYRIQHNTSGTLDHVELDEKEAAIGTLLGLARPARGDHHLELLRTGGGQGGSDPLLRNADQDLEVVALNKKTNKKKSKNTMCNPHQENVNIEKRW